MLNTLTDLQKHILVVVLLGVITFLVWVAFLGAKHFQKRLALRSILKQINGDIYYQRFGKIELINAESPNFKVIVLDYGDGYYKNVEFKEGCWVVEQT